MSFTFLCELSRSYVGLFQKSISLIFLYELRLITNTLMQTFPSAKTPLVKREREREREIFKEPSYFKTKKEVKLRIMSCNLCLYNLMNDYVSLRNPACVEIHF